MSETEDVPKKQWSWISRVPRDVVLVILGAMLALGVDEWRESRQRRARAEAALDGVRDEIRANVGRVTRARERHAFIADTLGKLAATQTLPPVEIYRNGMFNPALVTNAAWQMARETGALADIPLPIVLEVATVYDWQERYRSLTETLLADIMSDIRRDGMNVVLRDRYTQFIPLAVDFGSRERALLERYQEAQQAVDSLIARR